MRARCVVPGCLRGRGGSRNEKEWERAQGSEKTEKGSEKIYNRESEFVAGAKKWWEKAIKTPAFPLAAPWLRLWRGLITRTRLRLLYIRRIGYSSQEKRSYFMRYVFLPGEIQLVLFINPLTRHRVYNYSNRLPRPPQSHKSFLILCVF